jgi:hypothetical protein
MFAMEPPPAVPMYENSSKFIQSADSPAAWTSNYVLKICQETESAGPDGSPPLFSYIYPAAKLENYWSRHSINIDISKVQIKILRGADHGNLVPTANDDKLGLGVGYVYTPSLGFLGDDRVIFEATYKQGHYRIDFDIRVLYAVDERATTCPEPSLAPIGGKSAKMNQDSSPSSYQTGRLTVDSNSAPVPDWLSKFAFSTVGWAEQRDAQQSDESQKLAMGEFQRNRRTQTLGIAALSPTYRAIKIGLLLALMHVYL